MSEKADMIATSITMAFGERCPNYSKGCPCCDAWKQYDDLRALQDERDGGWQDIATAPKDGTEIVAHDIKTGTSHVTHFVAQFSWQHNWHDPDSHYYSEAPEFKPTHWRPLPRPPHSKDSEG